MTNNKENFLSSFICIFPTPAHTQVLSFHICLGFCPMPYDALSFSVWIVHTKPTCLHSQVKGRMDLRRMQWSSVLLLQEKKNLLKRLKCLSKLLLNIHECSNILYRVLSETHTYTSAHRVTDIRAFADCTCVFAR